MDKRALPRPPASSSWLASLHRGVHIVQRTRGLRDAAVLPGSPLLPPGGQGIVDVATAFGSGPFLLSGLASSPLASACCAVFIAPPHLSLPLLSPLFSVVLAICLPVPSPLSSATPASIPTAVLDLELYVSLLCSADSSRPIPPSCLKDSACIRSLG